MALDRGPRRCTREVPRCGHAADGPFDVTLEKIEELSKTYDVMLHNVRDGIGIYLDEKYKRFSTR